jgi:hypothetical protein
LINIGSDVFMIEASGRASTPTISLDFFSQLFNGAVPHPFAEHVVERAPLRYNPTSTAGIRQHFLQLVVAKDLMQRVLVMVG